MRRWKKECGLNLRRSKVDAGNHAAFRLKTCAVKVRNVAYNTAMRALLVLTLLLTTMHAFSQSASAPDSIIAQENAFWKAYADGNTTELSGLLLPDFINVEQKIWNRGQVLAFVRQFHEHCVLAPVKLVDPHVTFLTPDIATLVYHAIEKPTCGPNTMSGETNISSVWLRRDGRWQMHLHTEYAIPAQ